MRQMGASYGECLKAHPHMGGIVDGCQEFKAKDGEDCCSICSCQRNYHKKLAQVMYLECQKIHYVNGSNAKDGCKEYIENDQYCSPNKCAACNCHKSFHRNELIRRWEDRVLTGVEGRGCEKHADKYSKDSWRKGDSKKLGVKKQTKKEKQAAKDPNKPKRPASAFFVFMEDYRKQYKKKYSNNKYVGAVSKAGGDKWKSLSVEEKTAYVAKAEKRKEEYNRKMEGYNRKLAGDDDESSDEDGEDFNDEDDQDEREEEEEDDE